MVWAVGWTLDDDWAVGWKLGAVGWMLSDNGDSRLDVR